MVTLKAMREHWNRSGNGQTGRPNLPVRVLHTGMLQFVALVYLKFDRAEDVISEAGEREDKEEGGVGGVREG